MPNLEINNTANKQLQELSAKRKQEEAPITTKKSITEELIRNAHRKEIK